MFKIDFTNRIAWVSGASRGIGRSIAITLGQLGCHVAIGYNNKETEAQAVADVVKSFGQKAIIVAGDMSQPASVQKIHETIETQLGPIDILVNNAGAIADNLFILLEEEDWNKVIQANIMSVVHATKCVARGMMMKRSGKIINISSVAATKGGRGQANYAATKGAIEAMTRSLAVEFASKNICVNCIAPGVIETDMSKEVISLARDEILANQLVKRFGSADEIAAWVALLASTYGDFVTGQTFHIDGGMKM